jgi:hypothetical protein
MTVTKRQGSARPRQAGNLPCLGRFASTFSALLLVIAVVSPLSGQDSAEDQSVAAAVRRENAPRIQRVVSLDPQGDGRRVTPFLLADTTGVTGTPDSSADALAAATGSANEAVRKHRVDAWGVRHSPFLAGMEVVAINLGTWALNHWLRDADFTRVYPRTWWENISGGFEYDGNLFSTNVMDHPFHGSMYHNAGRANGLRFWSAVPYTIGGSFMWECCGETHPMALNDLINTGLGGIALGESVYRLSSAVLDNEATGAERFGRETAALVLNPIRGFNRVVSGHAFHSMPNPGDPDERTPGYFRMRLDGGYRGVGQNGSLQSPADGVFGALHVEYGDPFGGRRGGAFDVFELDAQMNFADRNLLGTLAIRGNLLTRDLKRGEGTEHVWAVVQGYEFDNTDAYQYGSQTVSARLESRWPIGASSELRTRLQGGVTILGTLDSEFEFRSRVPINGSLRTFEYGPGLDGRIEVEARAGNASVSAFWRTTFMSTINDTPVNGGDATHWLHFGKVSGSVPFGARLAVGTDVTMFLRDSGFRLDGLAPTRLTVPELRVYGSWQLAD